MLVAVCSLMVDGAGVAMRRATHGRAVAKRYEMKGA